jgi:predicted DNA-binding protein with PD1-like motif
MRFPSTVVASGSAVRMWAFRLAPGADLKQALASQASAEGLKGAFVAACVGSLARARLRLPTAAGEPDAVLDLEGPMEIVALSGTLSPEGPHLHIALSGRDGRCVGGHLLDGCIVHTTAELVIGDLTDLVFRRVEDPATGYRELRVDRRD